MVDPKQPASFEALREYLQLAVDQLIADLESQQVNYVVPSENVLALLERTAAVQKRTIWDEWESWALRHVIPIHDLVEEMKDRPLTVEQLSVMRKRLLDALGYTVLGIVVCERGIPRPAKKTP